MTPHRACGALLVMTGRLKIGERVRTAGGRTGVLVELVRAISDGEVDKHMVHDLVPRVAIVRFDDTGKEERVLVKELSLMNPPDGVPVPV